MIKKEAILKTIMLVQQLDPAYWDLWENKDSITTANNGDLRPLLDEIISKLKSNDIIPSEVYSILHDEDLYEDNSTLKPKHIHILFKFEKGATLNNIALAIGINPQYLEKLKSGRYGYDNCLAYLIHAKDENKHQYKPEDVLTILGENYMDIYKKRINTWFKGRATKTAKETNLSVDWLISKIANGEINKDKILLTNEYYTIYLHHKRKVNEAIDTYNEKKTIKTINDLEDGQFKKTIIYIQGHSGIGKTRFAKELIKTIKHLALHYSGEIWEHCITASTNAFDEFNSQEILLLDDIRGSSMNVSNWLKLLDPFSISPISARYHNKQGISKVIILTAPHAPHKFFYEAEDSAGEDADQFYRRIDFQIEVTDKFLLSTPYKRVIPKEERKGIWYRKNTDYQYIFSNPKSYKKDEMKKIIIKKIIRNMHWTKKDYPSADQSKKG